MQPAEAAPNELVDLIIRNLVPPPIQVLHNGSEGPYDYITSTPKPDLLAVSRVSRKWRACSLRYLFKDVHARLCPEPPTDAGVPQAFLRSMKRQKNIRSMLEFLSTRPEICRCIRQLSLEAQAECPSDIRRFWKRWEDLFATPMDAEVLMSILDLLPSLQELSLTDIVSTPPTRTLKEIATVRLGRCRKPAEDVLGNLSFFTTVKNLHFVFAELPVGLDPLPDGVLQTLDVESLSVHGEFPWLSFTAASRPSSTASMASLRSVSVGQTCCIETVQSMRGFFEAFCSQLVSLQCEMLETIYGDGNLLASEYVKLFDGLTWSRLRSITLRFGTYLPHHRFGDGYYYSWIWKLLADILARLADCPVLRVVTLEMLDGIDADELNNKQVKTSLGKLDGIIARFRQGAILTFAVAPGSQPLGTDHRVVFEGSMPLLHAAGKLRFGETGL